MYTFAMHCQLWLCPIYLVSWFAVVSHQKMNGPDIYVNSIMYSNQKPQSITYTQSLPQGYFAKGYTAPIVHNNDTLIYMTFIIWIWLCTQTINLKASLCHFDKEYTDSAQWWLHNTYMNPTLIYSTFLHQFLQSS